MVPAPIGGDGDDQEEAGCGCRTAASGWFGALFSSLVLLGRRRVRRGRRPQGVCAVPGERNRAADSSAQDPGDAAKAHESLLQA